mgnify:CR=1 FL=1
MQKKGLTKKESEVYENIRQYILTNQYPPSIQEIADMSELKSKSSAYFYVRSLIDKNYLECGSLNSPRTLRLVGYKCEFVKEDGEFCSYGEKGDTK